jgi:hypothetical protein
LLKDYRGSLAVFPRILSPRIGIASEAQDNALGVDDYKISEPWY